METRNIKCPKCDKLIAKADKYAITKGIYFWCPRCKENFEIITDSAHK